jgi:hypothetical protein
MSAVDLQWPRGFAYVVTDVEFEVSTKAETTICGLTEDRRWAEKWT